MPHTEHIPEWELDSVRDALVDFYTHHCRVEGTAETDDEYGGTTQGRTVRADNVPCFVEGGVAHQQDAILLGGVERESELFTISMPAYTEVYNGDVIVVYADEHDPGGGSFEVVVTAVIGPESYELERRAIGYRTANQ
jgi:hypothetical protein